MPVSENCAICSKLLGRMYAHTHTPSTRQKTFHDLCPATNHHRLPTIPMWTFVLLPKSRGRLSWLLGRLRILTLHEDKEEEEVDVVEQCASS